MLTAKLTHSCPPPPPHVPPPNAGHHRRAASTVQDPCPVVAQIIGCINVERCSERSRKRKHLPPKQVSRYHCDVNLGVIIYCFFFFLICFLFCFFVCLMFCLNVSSTIYSVSAGLASAVDSTSDCRLVYAS